MPVHPDRPRKGSLLGRRAFLRRSAWHPTTALLAAGALPWGLASCASVVETSGTPYPLAPPWPDRPMLLLGELHDNPDHHRLRAEGLVAWVTSHSARSDARPTAVAFEPMNRSRNADLIATYRSLGLLAETQADSAPGISVRPAPHWKEDALDAAADQLAEAGGLDRRGWAWPLHRPIVVACLRVGARVIGANLEATEARDIARRGASALPPDIQRTLEADRGWSTREQRAAEAEIDRGHCSLLPPARWPAMVLAQRARDAAMAQVMVEASDRRRQRVVLIAGNGHVRRDLGVPRSLLALGLRPRDLHSVAYRETPAVTMARPEPGVGDRFDQIVYTTAVDRPDPCQGLAGRL